MTALALSADRSALTTLGGTALSLVSMLFLVAAMAPAAMHAMMG
ncbi:hypothetical protein ACFCW2_06300 [Qipengyuania sp. DSG2-2]